MTDTSSCWTSTLPSGLRAAHIAPVWRPRCGAHNDNMPDYALKDDRSHACAVPWVASTTAQHWCCAECGRWWSRTWELVADQPSVDEDTLLQRAGITADGPGVEIRRQKMMRSGPGGLDYALWLPEQPPPDRGWPLVVFLHGGGESGGHPSRAVRGGLPMRIERGWAVPWVVASPHCPTPPHPNRQGWSGHVSEGAGLVREIRSRYPIDEGAILLTGMSMGAFGSWEVAARYPTLFSALAPVSGGGDPRRAGPLSQLQICVIHGALDTAVPVGRATEMIDAVRQRGGPVHAVIYPDANHGDAIERAYSPTSELFEWFRAFLAADR
jgi:poly(3-hydroxybutyrate) depolymerase